MSESLKTEPASTTGLPAEQTPKESTKPSVEIVPMAVTTLTRTKSEAEPLSSEPVEKVTETTSDSSSPSPNELVNLGRPPYVTDLLEARMAYETFDVKEQLHEIDEFIRDGIEDSRTVYEDAFNGIKAQVGEQDSVYTVIAKMREYVQLQNKIKGIIKEKEAFEAKSPDDMSADELKRLLNGEK